MAGLFDELVIDGMTARNRVVRAATAESLADADGRPTPALRALYGQLADGGAGTVITGYACVSPDGKPSANCLAICDDSFAQDYRALVGAVHGRGARIVLQLVHSGSKSRVLPVSEAGGKGTGSLSHLAESAFEASGLPARRETNPVPFPPINPASATADDLARIAGAFASAAARARECGFDGVEVHAAHGYLLSQFLDARLNRREDEYGGTLANRARLACECVAAVRDAVGDGFPVLVKLNSCDVRADPRGAAGGLSEDESARVAGMLVNAGASCMDVSGDWHAFAPDEATGQPFFGAFAARLSREVGVPVIATGGWRDPAIAARALGEAGIAAIGLARPLICEPGLVKRWQSGDLSPSRCTSCNHCLTAPGIPCALHG